MRLLALSGGALCALSLFVACGGDDDDGGGPIACAVDADCIEENPCSLGRCGADDRCTFEAVEDGAAPTQVEGDCRHTLCSDGAPQYIPDDSDDGSDDPCVANTCDGGTPRRLPSPDGSSCSIGNGDGRCYEGSCLVLCIDSNAQTQCDDGDPCTSDSCVECDRPECRGAGACDHEPQEGGTGPDDYNVCTVDTCEAGEPVHTPGPEGVACSSGGNVCNATGECVDCMADEDCAGQDVPTCFVPVCVAGTCESTPAPEGTVATELDTVGDCYRPVCGGTGSLTTEVDDSDVPDDLNPCTTDACTSGSTSHIPLDAGAECGTGTGQCNAYAQCCEKFVYDGSSSDILALRFGVGGQSGVYLSVFDPLDGSTSDIASVDVDAQHVVLAQATGEVFYMTSSGLGLLANCGGTELEPLAVPDPDTTTALSVPAALAYDSSDDAVLLASTGGAGVLYSYAPATSTWSEVASMSNVDAVASAYSAIDDKLYVLDATWTTTLKRYSAAGAFEADITLNPAITTDGAAVDVQAHADGSYLYYILHGYSGLSSWYKFVRVQIEPELDAGTTVVLYE